MDTLIAKHEWEYIRRRDRHNDGWFGAYILTEKWNLRVARRTAASFIVPPDKKHEFDSHSQYMWDIKIE